jgi:hypothetical protein
LTIPCPVPIKHRGLRRDKKGGRFIPPREVGCPPTDIHGVFSTHKAGLMSDENAIANLLAQKFIARKDVKAVQFSNGYMPVLDSDKQRVGWSRQNLLDHLTGSKTYGHYLLDPDSNCKLFAFDVDLKKNDPDEPFEGEYDADFGREDAVDGDPFRWEKFDPRESWLDRSHPSRPFVKLQLHELAHKLGKCIEQELEIPWAASYTGCKGIHVYGFTGLIPASDARDGAVIVMEALGFEAKKGINFYEHKEYHNFSVEIFPKQVSLEGKDLGNLMRLPLGKNLKNPKDKAFFLDMTAPMGTLTPLDPVYALTTTSQWKRPDE